MGNELEMFLRHGGRSIRDWLAKNGSPVFFEADADSDILFNVNSPEDLEAAEQRLRTASGDG
jgi:molybdopterin-guanine dinucleotide biosynthesis protein A